MRILFMGTPDIAAECLKALYAAGHEICGVYTRRDKPVGRKQVLTAPPVKEVALEHGTPVFQPRTLRDGSEDANIRALAPDLIVVVAYGCILPKSVLEAPKYGCINLHFEGKKELFKGLAIPRQRPRAVGCSERRHRDRRFHHADGRGAGHRRCAGLREDRHRPGGNQR